MFDHSSPCLNHDFSFKSVLKFSSQLGLCSKVATWVWLDHNLPGPHVFNPDRLNIFNTGQPWISKVRMYCLVKTGAGTSQKGKQWRRTSGSIQDCEERDQEGMESYGQEQQHTGSWNSRGCSWDRADVNAKAHRGKTSQCPQERKRTAGHKGWTIPGTKHTIKFQWVTTLLDSDDNTNINVLKLLPNFHQWQWLMI